MPAAGESRNSTDDGGSDSPPSVTDVLFFGVMGPHRNVIDEVVRENLAARDTELVIDKSRYSETVVTFEKEHPFRQLVSSVLVGVSFCAAIVWLLIGQTWPFDIPMYRATVGWWGIGAVFVAALVLGILSGEAKRVEQTRRPADSYYPPKEYWETVDTGALVEELQEQRND